MSLSGTFQQENAAPDAGTDCVLCHGAVKGNFSCPECRQGGQSTNDGSSADAATGDGNQSKKGTNLQRVAGLRKGNNAPIYKQHKHDRVKVSAEFFEPPKIADNVPNFKAPTPVARIVRSNKVAQFDLPWGASGVCCTPEGDVAVCQVGGRLIQVFTPKPSAAAPETFQLTQEWETPENTALWDMACNQGYIFVTDLVTESVLQFTQDGTHKRTVTVGFNGGAGLGVIQNTLYVTSCWDNNIYTMSLDSSPPKTSRFETTDKRVPMNMSGAGYIAASNTHVAVSIRSRHQVFVFTSGGVLAYSYGTGQPGSKKGALHTPEGLAFDSLNRLLIADCGNSRVVIVSSLGRHIGHIPLHKDGLMYPWGVALAGEGRLVVTASNRRAAALYQYEIL